MGQKTKDQQVIDLSLSQVLPPSIPQKRSPPPTPSAKPFVKWVGGKRSIIPDLLERIPQEYDNYYEPFVGGGALYFSLQPHKAFLSDINAHLVTTYQAIRDEVDELVKLLKIHEEQHCREYYLTMRQRLAKEKNFTYQASLFIYINKTCYNGLYRVNKSGGFNVPMGNYKNPMIADEENLRACSHLLRGTSIEQGTFEDQDIQSDDFYYLDPPYHQTYTGYSSGGFGDKMHKKLATFCREIDRKGGYFMLSNSDTPFVRALYEGYTVEDIQAGRSVSCKAHQRGKENELIIRNY